MTYAHDTLLRRGYGGQALPASRDWLRRAGESALPKELYGDEVEVVPTHAQGCRNLKNLCGWSVL